jgi:transcriptional regulator with XRE-family HTH domain
MKPEILKALIVRNKLSQIELAKSMGIKYHTLNAKLNGRAEFSRKEIGALINILHIENPTDIFFTEEVT